MEPDTLTLEKAIKLTSRIEVAVNEGLNFKQSETRATETKSESPKVQAVGGKSHYPAEKLNRSTHTPANTWDKRRVTTVVTVHSRQAERNVLPGRQLADCAQK
ncbi:hypothetical protein LSAT2_006842, partial [Lamellibrachia satsuma]